MHRDEIENERKKIEPQKTTDEEAARITREEMARPDWSKRVFEAVLRKMERDAAKSGSKVAGSYTSRDQPPKSS
jgi:hypothetical protein